MANFASAFSGSQPDSSKRGSSNSGQQTLKKFGSINRNNKVNGRKTVAQDTLLLQPMGLSEAFGEAGLPNAAEDSSVAYLRKVARHSERVSPADELLLAQRIEAGDLLAKRTLVQANLRLVLHVAKRYAGKGADFADLVQEGNLGLMKAVEKFNYRLGYRFSTYAVWWIHQSVGKAFAEHDRLIRLPGHVVDRVNQLRKLKEQWAAQQGHGLLEEDTVSDTQAHPADVDETETLSQEATWAQAMGVTLKKIQQLNQLTQKMLSLEAETQPNSGGGGRDEHSQTLADTLSDDRWQPEKDWVVNARPRLLARAMQAHLTERERDILCLRFGLKLHGANVLDLQWANPTASSQHGEKATLEAIGQNFGVTRECIRQTERRALGKLRQSPFLHQLMED
jgi:RNA polymerase primary sigma factor